MLRFAANLSMLYTKETRSLPERYLLAGRAGFTAVECAGDLYDYTAEELSAAQTSAGVQQVLINTWGGGTEHGGYGLAALPGKEQLFRDKLEDTIHYAKTLNCPRIRIMAGKQPESTTIEAMEATYIANLKYAGERLERDGLVGMIEPCNSTSMPGYLVNSYQRALAYITAVNKKNIRLQLDLFHLQQIAGNLTQNIVRYLPHTEHVQVAQVPDRHELDSPGELDYRYLLGLLEREGYKGWVGLEYRPAAATDEGLNGLRSWGYLSR